MDYSQLWGVTNLKMPPSLLSLRLYSKRIDGHVEKIIINIKPNMIDDVRS